MPPLWSKHSRGHPDAAEHALAAHEEAQDDRCVDCKPQASPDPCQGLTSALSVVCPMNSGGAVVELVAGAQRSSKPPDGKAPNSKQTH
jgi:hypothetical protein